MCNKRNFFLAIVMIFSFCFLIGCGNVLPSPLPTAAPDNTPIKTQQPDEKMVQFRSCWIEDAVKGVLNKELNDMVTVNELSLICSLSVGIEDETDISDLAMLTNLETLHIRGEYLEDISPLKGLVKLTELYLDWCPEISDLSPLKELVNMEKLSFYHGSIEDLMPLANMVLLKELNLGKASVSDLSGLSNLKELRVLNLYDTFVEDISELKDNINLEELHLNKTYVTDVLVLKNLIKLKELAINDTEVSREQFEELRKALPDCEISWGRGSTFTVVRGDEVLE